MKCKLFFLIFACLLANFKYASAKNERPNIILIMSDDMGYSDLGCYGGEINTPALDKLAKNGLLFTQFYNTARCCPTRASLMTGLHPHQTGIGHMTNTPTDSIAHNYGTPEYQGYLNNSCVTIAQVLKEAGYNTLMTGKWHLGYHRQETWPLQRGFDKFYGAIPGATNFFKPVAPRNISFGNEPIEITEENYYTTDAFTNYGIQFINESIESDENPFFLYLAYTAPHWPIQAPKEDVDKYRERYKEGWTKLREERYVRMKEMGLIDPNWKLTKQDSRDWNTLDDEKKEEMALRMAIYAAMVDRMDQNIARLVSYLEEKDILDNTIIMFLNDNGACAEGGKLGGGPASQLETKEGYFLTVGRAWANASNTPYREYKHWLHEGGIATPLIVHWPNGIKEKQKGSIINEMGFLPDIMATCLDIAGAEYPTNFNGNTITPHAGKSLAPIFSKNSTIHTETLFWEHEGNRAARNGKYKLVMDFNAKNADNWELYDMEADRSETNNLISEMPDKAQELKKQWENWAKEVGVMDWKEVIGILKKHKESLKEKK